MTQRAIRRGGFTLMEVIVALTLTAIAAGMAASALGAAQRTREVIDAHQRSDAALTRLRAMLTDALRHGVPAEQADEPLLQIDADARGPVLRFLSRGIEAPFGTGPIWRVTVRRDGGQLRMEAEPLRARNDAAAAATLSAARRAEIPDVAEFDVRVLEGATAVDASQWRGDWPLAQARPAAVALSWRSATGVATRLVVPMDPLAGGAP